MDPFSIQEQWDEFVGLQPSFVQPNFPQANLGQQLQWQPPFPPPNEQRELQKYTAKDWDTHKPEITRLYKDGTLEDVIKSMRNQHGLNATPKQYKDRFKKWGINKNVQPNEMEAIIRKQQTRASDSQNPKKTAFRVRKQPITQAKIDRFVKEHAVERLGSGADDMDWNMSPAATPGGVSYYTPSNTGITSPPPAPFSHQSPPNRGDQFGHPVVSLPNSPPISQMTGSLDIIFTGQSPTPFTMPITPLPRVYDLLQDDTTELMYDTGDPSTSPHTIISPQVYATQLVYATASSFQQPSQRPVTFQNSRSGQSDILNNTLVAAIVPVSTPLSEVYASFLLSVEDAQAIDRYKPDSQNSDPLCRSHELGMALGRQGRYDAAEQVLRHTLAIRQEVLGIEHLNTLASMHELAIVFQSQGKYDQAEELFQQVLEGWKKTLGKEHPNILVSMYQLAVVFRSQGKYDQAEELLQQVLKREEKTLGKEHPNTLTSMRELAVVFRSQGKYDQAEELFQQVLEGDRKTLGKEHPNTLANMYELAVVFRKQGKYDQAEELLQQVLEGWKKTLGKEHPNILVSMYQLAVVFQSQGKYDQAEELLQQVLKREEKTLGKEHPNTLVSMHQLAVVFQSQGKYDQAEELLQQVLEGDRKTLGKEHPNTLTSMHQLAVVFRSQDKYDKAEELLQQTLEAQKKVLGKEHPKTLISMYGLAYLLQSQQRYNESSAIYRKALSGLQKKLGVYHPTTLRCSAAYESLLGEMFSRLSIPA